MATAPNSGQAGFLAPVSAPVYDDPLDDILQQTVSGLTGIPGALVRPKWQKEPPQHPPTTTLWCAFGLQDSDVDTFAFEGHDQASSSVERDELLTFLISFIGPGAHGAAERFRDGLEVSQNRDLLRNAGIGLVEVQRAIKVPALFHDQWLPKVDVSVIFRRRTTRTFAVLSLQAADIELRTESRTDLIPVDNP